MHAFRINLGSIWESPTSLCMEYMTSVTSAFSLEVTVGMVWRRGDVLCSSLVYSWVKGHGRSQYFGASKRSSKSWVHFYDLIKPEIHKEQPTIFLTAPLCSSLYQQCQSPQWLWESLKTDSLTNSRPPTPNVF